MPMLIGAQNVGQHRSLEPIFQRLDTELPDVPRYLRAEFTPRSSIFSMLRTSYVEGGYVEGSNATLVNPPEAEAIANSVAACVEDLAYADRTFGVVVLQGQSQVDLIQHALLRRVGTEEWARRRLRVGTPPDFQGDERHVVWLSLVVAPEQHFAALTRDEFRRRFNVAASRAQDQLWLFHSVTADRLRPTDLRHSLLTYLLAADSTPLAPMLHDVSATERHERFDSLFEQRVFLDLAARGYHVVPQVETNGRRIDLVVTGAAGKLAVECDGDAFHTTPEQREADLHREQELKRCGWTFWRIRESTYYLNKERALASLWTTLDRLGIGPFVAGSDDSPQWIPTHSVEPSMAEPSIEDNIPLEEPAPSPSLVLPIPTTVEPGSTRDQLLRRAYRGAADPSGRRANSAHPPYSMHETNSTPWWRPAYCTASGNKTAPATYCRTPGPFRRTDAGKCRPDGCPA